MPILGYLIYAFFEFDAKYLRGELMVIHVVMFKFCEQNKNQNILEIKNKLESLKNEIETIVSLEVGIDVNRSERAYDMSLIVAFENEHDLKQYATHPKHLAVLDSIRRVVDESIVVDYLK